MDTTNIEHLKFNEPIQSEIEQSEVSEEIKDENLVENIFNLENDINTCLICLHRYYKINGEQTIEIISRLSGMYQFSGSKNLENLLILITTDTEISSFLKLEALKSLLSFDIAIETIETTDDNILKEAKLHSNEVIIRKNENRKQRAYKCLNDLCNSFDNNIATPCKIESVCMLMECSEYKYESNSYFIKIINDRSIDSDFRYKTILSLESEHKWKIQERQFFLKEACLQFLNQTSNMTMYRILAGQYLLQKIKISPETYNHIENIILSFSEDDTLDYNLRADAADTLLSLGSSNEIKLKARNIITLLGNLFGRAKTVFENAQNVHVEEIEESVAEVLEFLSKLPFAEVDNNPITFDYVNGYIEKMLKEEKETFTSITKTCCEYTCIHIKCVYCESCVINEDYKNCCKDICHEKINRQDKIKLSLNRICVDRILYSKYNQTLLNILLKVWTYISTHVFKETMLSRLLEELYDMSGTCSSGFASRLINTISGFGEFNIRISWEDQIIANMSGRLNALILKITDHDSIYFGKKHREILELYLRHINKIKTRFYAHELEDRNTVDTIIDNYLKEDRAKKREEAVEYFYESVISEMSIPVHLYYARQNFLKFFRDNMLSIREQLYEEFKDFITDTEFDLYTRKAISHYEGF